MEKSLLIATENKNGYTWTLVSRLGEMLNLAEKMFGPRNKDFTILGIEFCASGPRVWYPRSEKNIIIQLSLDALNSEKIALYQLAHESIHCLSPSGQANANVLEEGLATWFSWFYVKRTLGVSIEEMTNSVHYQRAGELVEKIIEVSPDGFRKIRASCQELWNVDPHLLKNEVTDLNEEEITLLLSPFSAFASLKQDGAILTKQHTQ
jgi:hypothetical protein